MDGMIRPMYVCVYIYIYMCVCVCVCSNHYEYDEFFHDICPSVLQPFHFSWDPLSHPSRFMAVTAILFHISSLKWPNSYPLFCYCLNVWNYKHNSENLIFFFLFPHSLVLKWCYNDVMFCASTCVGGCPFWFPNN